MTKEEREQYERDLAAVQKNAYALQYVKNQTPEICLAAVQKSPYSLKYVKTQTDEICMAAVTKDGLALLFVQSQTDEICLAAVRQYGKSLEYVKKQAPEICMAAAQEDGNAMMYIKRSDELKDYLLKNLDFTDHKRFSLIGGKLATEDNELEYEILNEVFVGFYTEQLFGGIK